MEYRVIRSKRNCTGMEPPIRRVLHLAISRISPVKAIGLAPRITGTKTKAKVRKMPQRLRSRSSICWILPGTMA